MVRKLLLIFAFTCFFLKPSSVSAVNIPVIDVPMLECGMGGAPDGLDRCCTGVAGNWLLPINDYLSYIPGLDQLPFFSDIKKASDEIDPSKQNLGKSESCVDGVQSTSDPTDPSCVCKLVPFTQPVVSNAEFCTKYINSGTARSTQGLLACQACMSKAGGGKFFWSAIGCVPISISGFVSEVIFVYGIGLAGMIAFICILYNAFKIQTSEGNGERLKKAQEGIKSCIFGLLLILFSVLLVRIVGVDILRIPGLSF